MCGGGGVGEGDVLVEGDGEAGFGRLGDGAGEEGEAETVRVGGEAALGAALALVAQWFPTDGARPNSPRHGEGVHRGREDVVPFKGGGVEAVGDWALDHALWRGFWSVRSAACGWAKKERRRRKKVPLN